MDEKVLNSLQHWCGGNKYNFSISHFLLNHEEIQLRQEKIK